MDYRNILPLVSHTQEFSTDYWNDFGYWNDGTFWYEKTPTYTARVTAYAAATGITDYTILDPLNIFDLGLTYYGLDTIMKAVYPMVTDKTSQSDMANQMKYNFMNPLDTNPAYRLQWFGGWIYSRTGALPNGVNAYADTNLIPSSNLQLNSAHLSYYSRTNSTGNFADIGAANNSTNLGYTQILCRWSDNKFYATINDNDFSDNTVTDSLGFFIGSRNSSTNVKTYKNGNIITSKTTATSTFRTSNSLTIGARNLQNGGISNYSNRQCPFASIGDGLTDSQAQIFSSLVNNLQKALNRAVY